MNENYIFKLPDKFKQNILGLHAEKGEQWLDNLPNLIAEISKNWLLSVEKPFPKLSYNFVAPCICADGTEAVLKIGYNEENSIIFSEAKFLKLLGGKGAVKLLQFDQRRCAMLLEKLVPGENLKKLCVIDDERATQIAINVLRQIRREPSENAVFPTLRNWTASFQKAGQTNFSYNLVQKAQAYFAELTDSSAQPLLLHGDFHHENILSAGRESFLAIDPKGIIGDIGFEISVFLNNPRGWLLSHPNRKMICERRIENFAQNFQVEPRDLRKWAFAEAVLSAWWTIEDGGVDTEKWLACAEIWET